MVALASGAKPLQEKVGSEDQILTAKLGKMPPVEGCRLHPHALEELKLQRVDFPDWLSCAKDTIVRRQCHISELTKTIDRNCQDLPTGTSGPVKESFNALKGQLEGARGDMCRVLDEFCYFSSQYHFRAAQQGFESQPGHSQDLTSYVKSLKEAIEAVVPFITTIKRLYELDIKAFERPDLNVDKKQPAENLERVTELLTNLGQLMQSLHSFERKVAESTTTLSPVRG